MQAAVDLGTNTILMVIGRRRHDGGVEILDDVHAIARLGQGVDALRQIQPEAVDRVCGFLADYHQRAARHGVQRLRAFGTSALRDAANKAAFVAAVAERTGIELTQLSGDDEARYTFGGAGYGLDLPDRYAVIDIGGGSTELACGSTAGGVEASQSVDVGAVRVTERHFVELPPTAAQRHAAEEMIDSVLSRLFPLPAGLPLVGVAGTAATLGALDSGAKRFDAETINGHFLSVEAVCRWCDELLALPYEEIRALPQVSDQRADIIGAGALVLRTFLERAGSPGLIVSTRGIRYGLLVEMLAGNL